MMTGGAAMNESTDYDGGWKETLELFLRPFLELCFPEVASEVDWDVPVEFLDTELQQVVRDAESGRRHVDKLVRVRQRDGADEWVLIHIEIQSQPDQGLPYRLYEYHHRIVDRFRRRAATLAVLADERKDWRPDFYEDTLWRCRVRFEYPVCKLLDFAADPERLESSSNPAAIAVSAHLAAQTSRSNLELRKLEVADHAAALRSRMGEAGYSGVVPDYRLVDGSAGRIRT
jgi:hypothetical protein